MDVETPARYRRRLCAPTPSPQWGYPAYPYAWLTIPRRVSPRSVIGFARDHRAP